MTIILIQIMLNREEDNYGRQKKKYSVIQLNEYKDIALDVSVDGFSVHKYLIYSDGSVRIRLYWRNVNSTDGQIIHRTCNLPLTINSSKYHCVTITQSDANVWHNDVAYQLFDTKIDLHVNSYSVDYMSTLLVDIFAFI